MSHNANNASFSEKVLLLRFEETSHGADANVGSDTSVIDPEIDRRVPDFSVAEYKTRNSDLFDARRLGAMSLDCANSFVFNRSNVRRDMNTGAYIRARTRLEKWCPDTLKDAFGFGMPTVRDG